MINNWGAENCNPLLRLHGIVNIQELHISNFCLAILQTFSIKPKAQFEVLNIPQSQLLQ